MAVDRHVFWAVFKLDFEFVSDPNSEFFIFFSSWDLCLYIGGCCTLICNQVREFVFGSSRVNLFEGFLRPGAEFL